MKSRTFRYACAAALTVLAVRMGVSQTTRPATAPATLPGTIPQPQAFVELAAKAAKIRGVHAVGRWELARPPLEGGKARKDVFAFEVWAAPPRMRASVDSPSRQTRVSDGQFVYTYAREPRRPVEARRRALSEANVYHAAGLGGPVLDAARGYASLVRSVRLCPMPEPAGFAKAFPKLKWFRIEGVTMPRHHLVAGTAKVIVGISPADGLMRVMIAQLPEPEKPPTTSSVFFDKVTVREVKAEEMMLPNEAGTAQWMDTDRKQAIPVPTQLIAPNKP